MRNLCNKEKIIQILRVLLPLLCAAMTAFIFGNSLQSGAQSSAQSSKAVEIVQNIAKFLAPKSKIATATGADYDRLHACIRALAHVAEFAVLGALAAGCCAVYPQKKTNWLVGFGCLALTPIADELLQGFTANRAMEFKDMLLDFGGIVLGFGLVLTCFYILLQRKKEKENNEADKTDKTETK